MSAGSPSRRRITVRSVSCRGVKSFIPFQKPPLYVAVSLGGRREKAPADPDGGDNPDWDGAVFAFDFDGAGEGPHDGLLQFEVKAQVPLLSNKLVGTTCVPVSHLSGGGGGGTAPQRVSYQVLAPDGKPNGSLSFVYAVTGGGVGAYQLPAAPNGARPEQDLSFPCPPPTPPSSSAYPPAAMPNFAPPGSSYPPPPSSSAYPPPATPNFAPPGSSYPPPPSSSAYPPPAMPNFAPPGSSSYPPPAPAASTSLYPPLQGMLPLSDYPPPAQMMDSLFPASNSGLNSSYPPPPPPVTAAYPPTPASSAYYPVPSTQHISSSYPPPPPSGYPPEFPAPTSSYPPPPPPESRSMFSVLPRSMPSPVPRSVDRELPSMAPWFQDSVVTYPALPGPPGHSGGTYYPPSGLRHREDGASSPYYYPHPHPGARYS